MLSRVSAVGWAPLAAIEPLEILAFISPVLLGVGVWLVVHGAVVQLTA